jgi:hypothetical protein
MIFKIPVGGVEKNANIRLVAGAEVKQGHPDAIKTAEFPAQAAGIGGLANTKGFPACGLRSFRCRNIEFTRDPSPVQSACLGD